MDDDGVIPVDVEHADLQQRSVGRRSDEHGQVVTHGYRAHRVAGGVPDVRVGDAMLPRWPTDPHFDNVACLRGKTSQVVGTRRWPRDWPPDAGTATPDR